MALVSPGQQITVTDESQYISNAVGTVPLVLLATAQDKMINGTTATGTSKANAGKLQIFGSQRELTTAMGTPMFQQSSAGTPLHGDELNEYGLMAAYSALGINNQLYAVRADIDLDQLVGTSVRPTSPVADGTYWFDLADTTWGINQWDPNTQSFSSHSVGDGITVITDPTLTANVTQGSLPNEPTPLPSFGQVDTYAVVATTTYNRVFYKAGLNVGTYDPHNIRNKWVLLGTPNWHNANPAVVGNIANPTITVTANVNINGHTITANSATLGNLVAVINSAAIPGVKADALNNTLALYGDTTSTGVTGDGLIQITTAYSGAGNTALIDSLGISTGVYSPPQYQYSNFANAPYWTASDPQPAPYGSVWMKLGATGNGANMVFKKYNATTDAWITQAHGIYTAENSALYGLDPTGGGANVPLGTVYVRADPGPQNAGGIPGQTLGFGGFRPRVRIVQGAVSATGAPVVGTPFTIGSSFTIGVSQVGSPTIVVRTITLGGTSASEFVQVVQSANIPDVYISLNPNNSITITHQAGGTISMTPNNLYPDILTKAGFSGGLANVYSNPLTTSGVLTISGFAPLDYTYSFTQPVADPADGSYWYYSDPTTVDVMINNGVAWKGYQNAGTDLRGYNLAMTDPNGVIAAASSPTSQTDGTALVAGDLWLDTGDLVNFPALSRWNGKQWIAIDNTDQITSNGILFADARWDTTGTTDPASGTELTPAELAQSDYLDLDAPNPALYPRGMLLFNTRRSGYNVKRYVENYFNLTNDNVAAWAVGTSYNLGDKVYYGSVIYVSIHNGSASGKNPTVETSYWAPLRTSSWVSSSGLKLDGSMYAGNQAQRQIVVAAMKSALDSNTEIREDQFKFSLICAPGYPELISDMVSLNNDRSNTAFVIGDTPMDLSTNAVDLINWSNDTNGDGLATSDPYLGVYYPSGLSSDLSGHTIMVPPSHMALRTYLYNDNVAYQWFAPAGTRRGLVSNATDLGYLNRTTGEFVRTGVNQALRDVLYQNKINPITIIPGIGLVVWGQKTRDPNTESMDRVNVARLVNYIRTIFASAGNAFLFEPNDKITRDQFKAILNRALNDLVAKRGIYDYLVVCDTTNNTPDRIANNQLYADVAIEPMKDVEFIYIPIRLYNPGDIAKLGSK